MDDLFSGTKPVDEALAISKSNLQQWMNENIAQEEIISIEQFRGGQSNPCLLYTSPSPRDLSTSRMPSSA